MIGIRGDALAHLNEQILKIRGSLGFPAYAFDRAALILCRFLTLKTEHEFSPSFAIKNHPLHVDLCFFAYAVEFPPALISGYTHSFTVSLTKAKSTAQNQEIHKNLALMNGLITPPQKKSPGLRKNRGFSVIPEGTVFLLYLGKTALGRSVLPVALGKFLAT